MNLAPAGLGEEIGIGLNRYLYNEIDFEYNLNCLCTLRSKTRMKGSLLK